jgi:hypothetical protein
VELLDRAREQTWYRTLELPGGGVTPGIFGVRPRPTTQRRRTSTAFRLVFCGSVIIRFAFTVT